MAAEDKADKAPAEAMAVVAAPMPGAEAAVEDAAKGLALFKPTDASKRGIPEAIFIDNVEAMCKDRSQLDVVKALQELYSKYQYMQSSLLAQRAGLRTKLPDISTALETVNHLVERRNAADGGEGEEIEYTYQLSENIWSRAMVAPQNHVCLWLGANCMLEYTLDEAVALLSTNEVNAKTTLKTLDEDCQFLRDQITTTEVNIARAHNFGVKQRQKAKEVADEAQQGRLEDGPKSSPAALGPPPAAAAKAAPAGGSGPDGAWTWKQEREEIEVSVVVPKGTLKGDVKVAILVDSLRVEAGGKVLLEGELARRCRPDDSTWTLNKDRVDISLGKAESGEPWQGLLAES